MLGFSFLLKLTSCRPLHMLGQEQSRFRMGNQHLVGSFAPNQRMVSVIHQSAFAKSHRETWCNWINKWTFHPRHCCHRCQFPICWPTSTGSLCIFAHSLLFIIGRGQFPPRPVITAEKPRSERSIFISFSHPHVLVRRAQLPRLPPHENEGETLVKRAERLCERNENANLEKGMKLVHGTSWRMVIVHYSTRSCLLHSGMIQYLFNYGSL